MRHSKRIRRILGKTVQGLITLLLVSMLIFFATQTMPGDAAKVILGTNATPERVAVVREQLGLNLPVWQQYMNWLGGIFQGDWGKSLTNGVPVTDILAPRLRNTVTLGVVALIIMLPLSLVVGIISAQRRDGIFDKSFMAGSMVVNAVPEFVIGTLLVALLSTTVLHWFPPVALIPPEDMPWWHPMELVLPLLTLIVGGVAYLSRLVRVSFIDVMHSEYIQTAQLKGLSMRRILYCHALPNALAPIIPAASLVTASLISGTVVVEYLYSYPGVGLALVESVGNRDLPLIQAVVLIIAVAYFAFNFIADLLAEAGSTQRRDQ